MGSDLVAKTDTYRPLPTRVRRRGAESLPPAVDPVTDIRKGEGRETAPPSSTETMTFGSVERLNIRVVLSTTRQTRCLFHREQWIQFPSRQSRSTTGRTDVRTRILCPASCSACTNPSSNHRCGSPVRCSDMRCVYISDQPFVFP